MELLNNDIKVYKDKSIVKIVKDLSIHVGMGDNGIIIILNRENCFGRIFSIHPSTREAIVDFDARLGETSIQVRGVFVGLDDIEVILDGIGETGTGNHRVKKTCRLYNGTIPSNT